MDKFISKKIYKQKDPIDTINQIKSILNNLNINLKETSFYHESSTTYASELRLDYPELGKVRIATNGKGMSENYSLASAYGEMMERIQCGALFYEYTKKAFDKKDIKYLFSKDEKYVDAEEILNSNDVMSKLTNCDKEIFVNKFKGKKLLVAPFYDVINDKTVYLPIELLFYFVSSNGMCAGNTPKEAIAQGMNELYERQALLKIYRDNYKLKKLDKKLFEGSAVYNKLLHVEELGYKVDVIDCSMDEDYPVIGLRLTKDGELSFNVGADPNPIVALERCLTEQYQVITEESLRHRFSKDSCGTRSKLKNLFEEGYYHLQFIRTKVFNSGEKPDNVHDIEDIYSDKYTYNVEDINDYDYLLSLTKKLGYSLYIRDCSYLGFPAYITFIPEISFADYTEPSSLDKMLDFIVSNNLFKDKDGYEAIVSILRKLEEIELKPEIRQDKTIFE